MDLRATILCCLISLVMVQFALASCEHCQRQCGDSGDIGHVLVMCNTLIQSVLEQEGNRPSMPEPSPPTSMSEPEPTREPPPPIGSRENPASSCRDIPQNSRSGEYFIQTGATGEPIQVYCDMDRSSCSCNTSEIGWMRVADLNITNTNQNCPYEFRLIEPPQFQRRSCARPGAVECVSTTFSTNGVEYSHVCGKIIGYQYASPDAFNPYFFVRSRTIDDPYVDGISLTHGQSPRQHIWTFANALDETVSDRSRCPCSTGNTFTSVIPPFVGQDYFCDSGTRNGWQHQFYPDDPLWDGQGCGDTSTCCQFNNPPWFCKQLSQPTTDDIELRLCSDEGTGDEDSPFESVEIYVR